MLSFYKVINMNKEFRERNSRAERGRLSVKLLPRASAHPAERNRHSLSLFVKIDLMAQQEAADGVVKSMLQGFVHGKYFQGDAGGDQESPAAVLNVEEETCDVFRLYRGAAGFAQRPGSVFREKEDKAETDRGPFSPYDRIAPGFDS